MPKSYHSSTLPIVPATTALRFSALVVVASVATVMLSDHLVGAREKLWLLIPVSVLARADQTTSCRWFQTPSPVGREHRAAGHSTACVSFGQPTHSTYTTNVHCSCGVRVSMLRPRLRWSSISAAAPIIRP